MGHLSSIKVLSDLDCSYWQDKVFKARSYWIERLKDSNGNPPVFYTLGRAIYLDVAQSDDLYNDYFLPALESNAFLNDYFGELLEKMRSSLEKYLEEPVSFSDNMALPGFHIFFSDGIKIASKAEPHFDLQYLRIKWHQKWDPGKAISFTLPLALPASGGGLDIWEDQKNSLNTGINDDPSKVNIVHEKYDLGCLYVQSTMIRHRVANPSELRQEDTRITLQGHGLRFNGEWKLYW